MKDYDMYVNETSTQIHNEHLSGWNPTNNTPGRPERIVDNLWSDFEVAASSDSYQWHLSPSVPGAPNDIIGANILAEDNFTRHSSYPERKRRSVDPWI
ncbi:uncharacterized protein N7506_006967 [Penicillium brevicompactum]|uniref:uncharacterized protein n=1 Tax=Penicillium brevicompactum TaxID=5074 RepID=UPI00253F95DA|nr:uncharacterized protein N7506_006967 [Penicillium brevicompactum]KAJ5333184.1 hypothetical protein N7506_006967 [Penicillium brevicompactum]